MYAIPRVTCAKRHKLVDFSDSDQVLLRPIIQSNSITFPWRKEWTASKLMTSDTQDYFRVRILFVSYRDTQDVTLMFSLNHLTIRNATFQLPNEETARFSYTEHHICTFTVARRIALQMQCISVTCFSLHFVKHSPYRKTFQIKVTHLSGLHTTVIRVVRTGKIKHNILYKKYNINLFCVSGNAACLTRPMRTEIKFARWRKPPIPRFMEICSVLSDTYVLDSNFTFKRI